MVVSNNQHLSNTLMPVFLIGPVRSGSTFLRLMLDSHPDMSNPGECDFLFDLIDENGIPPDMENYYKWLFLNRIFQAKNLKTDKSLNYSDLMCSFVEQLKISDSVLSMNIHRHFYKIPHVFPNARYIHLIRDPRDVARSCIGMGWVGNVYYGVDIWMEVEKSWDILKKTLSSDQYLEIKYEDLLDDIKRGLTTICKFLGVEYSEGMMDYAKNSTYSLPDKNLSYQWKTKYSERDLQLVEGKVSKMLLDRGYKLSGYTQVKPGTIEKLALMIQNKKFHIRHNIKKYGFALYLKNVIANKFGINSWRNECQHRINAIDIKGLK